MSAISRNRGFTLLEVLVAVALLGILAAALYCSFFTVLRARDRSALGMEERRELGATIDLLRREISCARYSSDDSRLRFVVEDRDSFGRPASNLELTTLALPGAPGDTRRESGILDVQYRMVPVDKLQVLTRCEQDTVLTSTAPPRYPQMERISSFLVECYDGSGWVRSWDTALNRALPRQVRVTLQVEEGGRTLEFSSYATPRAAGS